jgi:hypothetical protein
MMLTREATISRVKNGYSCLPLINGKPLRTKRKGNIRIKEQKLSSTPSSENGNSSSFRNVVFFSVL